MTVRGRSFIIDAGHGGRYNGTTYGNRREKDITLTVARQIRDKLIAAGATVHMVRNSDRDFGGATDSQDINNRVQYINSNFPGVHALVSIHVNRAWIGQVGPFYQTGTVASRRFAESIANVYGTVAHEGNFAILRDNNRASQSTLVEISQIQESWLDDHNRLDYISQVIVNGMNNHFS